VLTLAFWLLWPVAVAFNGGFLFVLLRDWWRERR
jgi:hypothetical protein